MGLTRSLATALIGAWKCLMVNLTLIWPKLTERLKLLGLLAPFGAFYYHITYSNQTLAQASKAAIAALQAQLGGVGGVDPRQNNGGQGRSL